MTQLELLLLAVGLAMDAFAVSITDGLCCKELKKGQMLLIAVCFGGMQGIMPTLGFFLGKAFEAYIRAVDHYIALILLGYIGISMIAEALRKKDGKPESFRLTARLLLVQGVATSIDALAVGVSLAALPDVSILLAALEIAGVTFCLSLVGVIFGRRFGQRLGSRAQLVGGVILVCIGVKIFVEHMFFS